MSRAVTRLERSVGVVLLDRSAGRTVTPTRAGAALFGEAKIAFAHLGRGVLMARHGTSKSGLTVGLPPIPPTAELGGLISRVEVALAGSSVTLERISWRDLP